jgi:hypothetical protein
MSVLHNSLKLFYLTFAKDIVLMFTNMSATNMLWLSGISFIDMHPLVIVSWLALEMNVSHRTDPLPKDISVNLYFGLEERSFFVC